MRHRLPALLVAVLLVATACSDGAEASSGDRAGRAGDDDTPKKIEWKTCKAEVECAKVEVPLDHDKPDGKKIKVSVTRSPATGDSGDRIGALFVNPGGPGSTAGDIVDQFANLMPDPIHQRFDVIGVDPRGTGASKLDCGFDMAKLFGADPYVDDDDEKDALVEVNDDYVAACKEEAGKLLPHMGTRDAARDIDAVRAALGDDQISYLGLSYGTILGQAQAPSAGAPATPAGAGDGTDAKA